MDHRREWTAPAAATKLINFYNTDDYATNSWYTWRANSVARPDIFLGKFYGYALGLGWIRYEAGHLPKVLDLAIASERYEAFSFAISAHSYALGATPVQGVFSQNVDVGLLATDPNNPRALDNPFDHSAQFNGIISGVRAYWRELMDQFDIDPTMP